MSFLVSQKIHRKCFCFLAASKVCRTTNPTAVACPRDEYEFKGIWLGNNCLRGRPKRHRQKQSSSNSLDDDGIDFGSLSDNELQTFSTTLIDVPKFSIDSAPEVTADENAAALLDGSEHNLLKQMQDIFIFAGPALGIWLSSPVLGLIDTAVVGTTSSLELAALGPGTVFCDGLCYVFMFLSVATSNLIATSLANKDEEEAKKHLARLLFIGLVCGLAMLVITELLSNRLLQGFLGDRSSTLLAAASSYVEIRGLAWPAALVGMVAQSASLGMQDSWAPLKALAVASVVNAVGDIILCCFLGYGIAGAAWATAFSQYVACFLMLKTLHRKGYNPLTISVPLIEDLKHIIELASPVLLTMLSKVAFYTVITYLATSLGAVTLAAHQVMVGIYSLCSVWGEPLAQTAQSFMPALIQGNKRNLKQARRLLKTLLLIGGVVGLTLGCLASAIAIFLPRCFTNDEAIVAQMRKVTLPFFCSLAVTPPTLSLEGTLLAGRDLKFLGVSMATCFMCGSLLLMGFDKFGLGLSGSWWTLFLFQLSRFSLAYTRLHSSKSILNSNV